MSELVGRLMVFVAVIVVAGASYLSSKRTNAKRQAFFRGKRRSTWRSSGTHRRVSGGSLRRKVPLGVWHRRGFPMLNERGSSWRVAPAGGVDALR